MNCPSKQIVTPVRSSAARRRGATTLIEMLVVISLASVVMATVGVMIDGVWKAQNALGNQRVGLDNIARLADQFRADVHIAEEVEVEIPTEARLQTLVVVLPGEKRVEYQFDQMGVTRVVHTSDQITQRETYTLPSKCTADWKTAPLDTVPDAGGKQVSLLISFPLERNQPEYSDRREFCIDAVVGLHRLEIPLDGRKP